MIDNATFPRPALAALMLLVLVLSWFLTTDDQKNVRQKTDKASHIPIYFVHKLSMTSMGIDGLPERYIESSKVVQFQDDETTEMEAPKYDFFRPGQPSWHVQAEQGWLSADGELALLSGRVTIIRPASETTAPFKMVTSDLRIQPENNYLETDNAVKATSGKDQIDAIGMQAWMGPPSRIKFLSDVRSIYEPK